MVPGIGELLTGGDDIQPGLQERDKLREHLRQVRLRGMEDHVRPAMQEASRAEIDRGRVCAGHEIRQRTAGLLRIRVHCTDDTVPSLQRNLGDADTDRAETEDDDAGGCHAPILAGAPWAVIARPRRPEGGMHVRRNNRACLLRLSRSAATPSSKMNGIPRWPARSRRCARHRSMSRRCSRADGTSSSHTGMVRRWGSTCCAPSWPRTWRRRCRSMCWGRRPRGASAT